MATSKPSADEMFTAKEAAKYLGLSEAAVRAWLLHRRIDSVRVGRAVRIRRSVLERVIEAGTVPADRRKAIA